MILRKISAIIFAVLVLTVGAFAAQFSKSQTYQNNFSDVNDSEWYASWVKDAYEFGIMNGDSATTFSPDGTLTVAQGVTIASRIHSTLNGKTIEAVNGGEWYQMYVDYAVQNGIMKKDRFDGYDINIKRFEIAELFAAASSELSAINSVATLPDVAPGADYADDVLKLYNAGILMGNDGYGTFSPNSYLKRSEISAMAVRIADSAKRVSKQLDVIDARAFTDAYGIIENPWDVMTGWDYDNRFDLLNVSGSVKTVLADVSDTEFYAFRRNFRPEYEGVLRLEVAGNFRSGENGAYISFENAKAERVVEITANDGKWVVKGDGETASSGVAVDDTLNSFYTFVLEVDLDKNTAFVIVNNRQSEKVKIKSDAVIENLVMGTNKMGKGYVQKDHIRLSKNYVLDENFLVGGTQKDEKAASWITEGDFVLTPMYDSVVGRDDFSLKAESKAGSKSSVKKNYEPIAGKVVFEANVLFPEKTDGGAVSFTSGGKDVFKFEVKDGKFVMGDKVLHDYIPNVWQWLYVEADTMAGTAVVKVNGKKRADVTFTEKVLDGVEVSFAPDKDAVMWVDDLEIYPLIEHADYPSYPVVAESEGYNIGVNSCYLWRDEIAGEGWDSVSSFPEFDTYLGFYDEGLRETADWELKLMAEHGIDFIHACWYSPSYQTYRQTTPIKKMRFSHAALHDGYMNAKYSDLVDFCIMWENSWQDSENFEDFKEYIWNYWKEYYFSDDRYVRLDNKALLTIWDFNAMKKAFGGTEESMKAGIEFMNEDIKTLGYDGIIILMQIQAANGASYYQALNNMGLDGTYAYHWSVGGYNPDTQIRGNETSLNSAIESGVSHHIPTISVGFNCVGRQYMRFPVITGEDHLKVMQNAKENLDKLNTGTWKDNTIMISTWNEYSEGTYVMPTRGTGFAYLENIRTVFTNDTSDHTANDKPLTETQLKRIGHMYPENRSPLRRLFLEKNAEESFVFSPDMLETVRAYDMSAGGAEAWTAEFGIEDFSKENGVLSGRGTTSDYGVRSIAPKFVPIRAEEVPYLHIRLKVSVKKDFEVFFMTNTANGWSGTKRATASHTAAGEFCDYYFNMAEISGWKDEITGIRIDPLIAAGEFEISLVELMKFKDTTDITPKLVINGTTLDPSFEPEYIDGGDIAVAVEKAVMSSLRVFHKYDRFTENGVLTIKTNTEKTLVFKIGSDKVIIDGEEKELGYTVGVKDGLPVLHMKNLAELLGYKTSLEGIVLKIQSCTDEEYAKILGRQGNTWEFDFPGDIEGFVPQLGKIDVDGESKLVFVPSGSDVAVFKLTNIKANEYTHIVMGIEYTEAMVGQTPQLFFTTANNPTYGWNADNCINGRYKLDGKKPGDIVEVKFNLSDNANFAGTITGLRFDPFNVDSVFKIDYIRCIYNDKIDYDDLIPVENLAFEFNSDLGGWLGQNSVIGVADGYLEGESKNADSGILNPAVGFKCEDAQVVVMGVKYDAEYCNGSAELFFITDKSVAYSGEKRVVANYRAPENAIHGQTIEIAFDLTTNPLFKSRVTGVRIDLHDKIVPFSIDYIRFYKKDGYVPPDVKVELNKATMPTSVEIKNVTQLPKDLKVSAGGAGKLEIVDNPENPDEKVFKIASAVSGDHYTYLYVNMNFVAGKQYNISYKLYPLKNMNGEEYKTTIGGNILYGSDGKNQSSHVFDPNIDKQSGAGWIEVKTSLIIDTDYNPTENDRFELWGKPFNGAGVEYLVKDIIIKPAG